MAANSPYSVHPSVAYTQKVIANLKTKTGRSIDEWIRFVKKEGPKSELERRAWLKDAHKLGTNYAWWIAERADGKGGDEDSPEAYLRQAPKYVEDMFAGKRAPLRPIYDTLLQAGLVLEFREDVLDIRDAGVDAVGRLHRISLRPGRIRPLLHSCGC